MSVIYPWDTSQKPLHIGANWRPHGWRAGALYAGKDSRYSNLKANKTDIILALRGLVHTAGMNEFMLRPDASREEIEEKLSMLIGQITDRWREYFGLKSRR